MVSEVNNKSLKAKIVSDLTKENKDSILSFSLWMSETIVILSFFSIDNWFSISKVLIESISSSKKSIL